MVIMFLFHKPIKIKKYDDIIKLRMRISHEHHWLCSGYTHVSLVLAEYTVMFAVESAGGSVRDTDVQFVAGELRARGPLFFGQLHSDPIADIWRNRPRPLPSHGRSVSSQTVCYIALKVDHVNFPHLTGQSC